VGPENFRSRQAMLKVGGVLREGEWSRKADDSGEPYVVYEIRKEQFMLQQDSRKEPDHE